MDARHKNQAFTGVAVWVAVILIFAGLLILLKFDHAWMVQHRKAMMALTVSGFVLQYVFFFWGGSHLAKGKGHSNGMLLFGVFYPAQMIILGILLFALPDKFSGGGRKKSRRDDESPIARIVRCRRNALVANVIGIMGMLAALFLVFVQLGLFESRDNTMLAALFVFVPSYAAVILGCWWWLKAKNWPDAVVFIGLSPLLLLIRRAGIFRLNLEVVLLLLVFMPILLIGVIAVLPDKSGMPKRKKWDRD